MENRNGLCVDMRIGPATGFAERDDALEMLRRLRRRGIDPKAVAGDRDTASVISRGGCWICASARTSRLRRMRRRCARFGVSAETLATVSQVVRMRVEEIFDWA